MRSDGSRIVDTYSTEDVWTVGWGTIRERVLYVEHPLYQMICKVLLLRDFGLRLGSLNFTLNILTFLLSNFFFHLTRSK